MLRKTVCFVALAFVIAFPSFVLAEQYLPVMAGEQLHCDQENNDTPTHSGALAYAWDYNLSGTVGDADLGLPLMATADGRIVYAQDYAPGQDDWGKCVVNACTDGPDDLLAHMSAVFVKVGEPVLRGQVLGLMGNADGRWAAHIHHQRQDGPTPNAQSVPSSYDDAGSPEYLGVYTSQNAGIFDREEVLQGVENVGTRQGDAHWWHGFDSSDLYYADPNHRARRCYIWDHDGGAFGPCAIVYDPLGGARRAYTVRTGFWGIWSQEAGPQGPHGMPITNEQMSASGGSRQEFQLGSAICDPGQLSVWVPYPHCAPGWTDTGWDDQFSYLFAMVLERNGGAVTRGLPTGNVYDYGPVGAQYKCQDLQKDDEYCTIFYDPNNAADNPLATNEAYLLRSGFRAHYFANGGYQAFGCPTRDEYMSKDPQNWDDPTLYPLQNFKADGDPDHYMISKNGEISFHSSYTTTLVSQTPSGQFNMYPGETKTFTVRSRNTGTTTWHNDPDAYPYYYVEMKSCDAGGNLMASFLNDPYDTDLNWLNVESPCTMNEASVPPGSIATFTFQGKVAANATPGLRLVYFRPNHSMVGEMDGWGGMHFQVNVVPIPTYLCELKSQTPSGVVNKYPGDTFTYSVQDWNRGNTTWWNNVSQHPNDYVEMKSCDAGGNVMASFLYDSSWLNSLSPCTFSNQSSVAPGSYATFTFTGRVPTNASPGLHQVYFRPNHSGAGLLSGWGGMNFQVNVVLPPQTDSAPKPDAVIAIRRSSTTEEFQGCPSTGSSFGTASLLISDFGDDGNFVLFGDVNGDGFDDCLTGKIINSTTVEWRLALSDGYGNLISQGVVISDFGAANSVFLVGDFNHDHKCDLAGGTPEGSTTVKWRVALSTGHDLASDGIWTDDFGNPGFRFFAGDVNGDGRCDLLNNNDASTSNVTWRYALSSGSSFGSSTIGRNTPRSTPQKFQVGTYTSDSRCDIAYSTRTATNVIAWSVCASTGSAFSAPVLWRSDIGDDSSQYFSDDMNFDGKCDLVAVTPISGNMEWRVARSTGSAFNATTAWKGSFGTSANLCFIANVFLAGGGKSLEPEVPDQEAVTKTGSEPTLSFRVVPNPTTGHAELWLDNSLKAVTTLQIFDLQGRLIRTMAGNGSLLVSPIVWDGLSGSSQRVPAGIYFLRLSTSKEVATKRITVIR